MITWFPNNPVEDEIPAVMPSPFSHAPHPLAEQAALILQQRLSTQNNIPRDFFAPGGGKMFGVLVVRDRHETIGFLSAFSGQMSGQWQLPGFVPPLFNQQAHDSFLPQGRDELAMLGEQIQKLENSDQRSKLVQKIADEQQQGDRALVELKQRHRAAKAARKLQRQALQGLSDGERQREMSALALTSQRDKREFTNLSIHWHEKLQRLQQELDLPEQQIRELKKQRKEKSQSLHRRVFETYQLNNHLHEQQPMSHFFADAMPPAGSGDCAAPKLIHYAHKHHLYPLALAEFWWGASPSTGVRHHGHYYPACRGKCRPILPFMLRGLNVEPEPCYGQSIKAAEPQTVYEDDHLLVVNKPTGLMSAPGKEITDSVFERLQQRYPENPELKLVHRLDMATSGLLLIAKNRMANKQLQKQFIQRKVEKRYEALLSERLSTEQSEGEINLPLRVDFDDRPRQQVCFESGKAAKTRWQVLKHEGETTRVWFYPQTGRTHQLRVHASHRDGLNAAIVGDALYGQAAERLMLHAQRLCFTHPVSRERLEFDLPAPF